MLCEKRRGIVKQIGREVFIGMGGVASTRYSRAFITVYFQQNRIINKDIVAFAAGETHLLFLNSKGELYGVGSAQYGQLGPKNTPSTPTITRLFEDISHKQIYATEYATFLIDSILSKIKQIINCMHVGSTIVANSVSLLVLKLISHI